MIADLPDRTTGGLREIIDAAAEQQCAFVQYRKLLTGLCHILDGYGWKESRCGLRQAQLANSESAPAPADPAQPLAHQRLAIWGRQAGLGQRQRAASCRRSTHTFVVWRHRLSRLCLARYRSVAYAHVPGFLCNRTRVISWPESPQLPIRKAYPHRQQTNWRRTRYLAFRL